MRRINLNIVMRRKASDVIKNLVWFCVGYWNKRYFQRLFSEEWLRMYLECRGEDVWHWKIKFKFVLLTFKKHLMETTGSRLCQC